MPKMTRILYLSLEDAQSDAEYLHIDTDQYKIIETYLEGYTHDIIMPLEEFNALFREHRQPGQMMKGLSRPDLA